MCWFTCLGEHKVDGSLHGQLTFRSSHISGCIEDVDVSDDHISHSQNWNDNEVSSEVSTYRSLPEPREDVLKIVEYCTVKPREIPVFKIIRARDSCGKKILNGATGKMYYGVVVTGREAAIRKIDPEVPSKTDFQRQVSKIARLKHNNVVELLGFCSYPKLRALVYEHATAGSLYDILYGRKGVRGSEPGPVLSWSQRLKIATGAARGLEYLHEEARPTVIHGNVKSSNVLIFDDHVAKLADPNISDQSNDVNTMFYLGSFGYNAPECDLLCDKTKKSDVYSFGVLLLELVTGRKPIDSSLEKERQSLVNWVTPNLREDLVEQYVDKELQGKYPKKALARVAALAALCTDYEAGGRPSMKIVVQTLSSLSKC